MSINIAKCSLREINEEVGICCGAIETIAVAFLHLFACAGCLNGALLCALVGQTAAR